MKPLHKEKKVVYNKWLKFSVSVEKQEAQKVKDGNEVK